MFATLGVRDPARMDDSWSFVFCKDWIWMSGSSWHHGHHQHSWSLPKSSKSSNHLPAHCCIAALLHRCAEESEDGGLGGFRVFGFTCAMPALPCYPSLCRSQESPWLLSCDFAASKWSQRIGKNGKCWKTRHNFA